MLRWLFITIQNHECCIFNYLDDFLIVASGADACNDVLHRILGVCRDVEVPVSAHKTEEATRTIVILGIGIDSAQGSLFIPQAKVADALNHINAFLSKVRQRVKYWQRLLGKLCHLSQIVVAGRAYLSSVYGRLKGIMSSDQNHMRHISCETRSVRPDLIWLYGEIFCLI